MGTYLPNSLRSWVHLQYMDGSNVCCSVESTWLRHLSRRGADNDKTGVLLTFPSSGRTTFFSIPGGPGSCRQATHSKLTFPKPRRITPPPFQHETSASLVDCCYKYSVPRYRAISLSKMSIPPEIIQVKRLVKKRKATDDDDEGIVDYLRP